MHRIAGQLSDTMRWAIFGLLQKIYLCQPWGKKKTNLRLGIFVQQYNHVNSVCLSSKEFGNN